MADRQAKGRTAKPQGGANGRSKLTEAAVLEIRTKYAESENATQQALADEYGIDRAQVSKIVRRLRWAHI